MRLGQRSILLAFADAQDGAVDAADDAGHRLRVLGYSTMPNYDDMFAGSNLDSDDYDDFNTIQRDLQIDGGLRHVKESEILAVRTRAAQALQAVFRYLDLPPSPTPRSTPPCTPTVPRSSSPGTCWRTSRVLSR